MDDVTLLATGPMFEETHWKLKDMMERADGTFEWSESHNSPFELTKLALMNFAPRHSNNTPLMIEHARLGRTTIVKATNSYQFLGVLFDPKFRWKAQHKKATRSVETWINLVKRLTHTASGVSARGMRQLYLIITVPKITYAAEVWYTLPHKPKATSTRRTGSVTFTNKIQSAQQKATITMLGAMGTTAGDTLNAHALIPPPHLLFSKALTRSATRLVSLPNFHPLYKPTRHCLKQTARQHTSPIDTLLRTTNIKPRTYKTILPAHRCCNYEPLAHIHIDNDRTKTIANAKAITGLAAYMDGSGTDGKIGAAAILMLNDTVLKTVQYRLGTDTEHTVYEVEMTAVILALHLLMQVE